MPDRIELKNVGLRYGLDAVLKSINAVLETDTLVGITGPNGSGKSTLLKVISGHLSPTKGRIDFFSANNKIPIAELYQQLTFSAPYIEIPDQMKLRELLSFTSKIKPWRDGLNDDSILELSGLEKSADKKIGAFSSGMKQRTKLLISIMQKSSLLILDEPGTNLDTTAKEWYLNLLSENMHGRIVVIASNEDFDLKPANRWIQLPA
ncbi:MAG: ATP-binding cassette domain-containing protein [Saprospirales bacterium]|nr:MAG: ATP-binding cassette domain-containing protein [Saprospirales bacterium]